MVDTIIMQFLTWAIPSGGIGAAIAWIANRKVKQAESAKQVHDTYKAMYEDISKELLEVQRKSDENARKNEEKVNQLYKENALLVERLSKENERIRRTLNRLSRAIEAIQLCPHRASCPVSGELQNSEDDTGGTDTGKARASKRQQRKPKPDGGEPDGGEADRRAMDGADVDHHAPARR